MPDPTPDACREAFERWAVSQRYDISKFDDTGRFSVIYKHTSTWHAWCGWAARDAAANKEHDDDGVR